MDCAKAKNILIIMFLILNIFLLIYSGMYKPQNINSNEVVISVLNILGKKGIKISEDYVLTTYSKKTPMLIIENYYINKNDVLSFLFGENEKFDLFDVINKSLENDKARSYVDGNKHLEFTGFGSFVYMDQDASVRIEGFDLEKDSLQDKQILKGFRELFAYMNIDVSSFVLDSITANEDGSYTLFFTENYNDYLIFDNRAKITVFNGGLRSIDFSISKIEGFSKSTSAIMPAHLVLLKNFYSLSSYGQVNTDIIISSIEIGFKGFDDKIDENTQNTETESTVQSPSWRVITKDGRVVYFKAYDGEEI